MNCPTCQAPTLVALEEATGEWTTFDAAATSDGAWQLVAYSGHRFARQTARTLLNDDAPLHRKHQCAPPGEAAA